MFDNIQHLYSQISSLDISHDKKYHYERIVYLAMYKLLFNQVELINARDYPPYLLIIPLECMVAINNVLLTKYRSCNDVIIADIEKEHNILLKKLDIYNNMHMNTITNQADIIMMDYAYKIQLHVIKTRLIANALEMCTIVINILTVVFINPVQFGCLLWFIDSVMSDMTNLLVDSTDKCNREAVDIERCIRALASEFVDNKNIIYECAEENSYLDQIAKKVNRHYNIRKDVSPAYKINSFYTDFEARYQRKVLLLTWVIPKSMFLTWIYTDLKGICNHMVMSLISYKDISNKIQLLNVDKQTATLAAEIRAPVVIDPRFLANGVLFRLRNVVYTFNKTLLFKNEGDLVIPSMKWITLRGESGSGKTTLCSLLLKTIPDNDADIVLMDEYNEYDYNSIRKLISCVKPNMDLFDKSIEFNLTFGVKNGSSSRVGKQITFYMEIFGLSNLIDRLDKNINDLSTGEKQRVKIIRCILQDKPIWFLDEITSNLDSDCEQTVMSCLRQIQIKKNKSVIHISHNPELIKYSDCNISIDDKTVHIQSSRKSK